MRHPDKRPSVRPPGSRGQRRGLRPIHPDAVETDIGSTAHYVAVPEDLPVRTRRQVEIRTRFGSLDA
jgi:hypothetical protein